MALIEDYAIIGDTHSIALISRDGSIDWLCLPRFDSPSSFAALLDDKKGGRWRIAPRGPFKSRRRYHDDSLILETIFETDTGSASLTDCLPLEETSNPHNPRTVTPEDLIVRVIHGISGSVDMEMEFAPRFDYGNIAPWMKQSTARSVESIGGPDAIDLVGDVDLVVEGFAARARFSVSEKDKVSFVAEYRPSHEVSRRAGLLLYADELVERTDEFWREWVGKCSYEGEYRDAQIRSLLTLKALTYSPTGGIVAAATTSLPEQLGGVRNWDYRFCWLRDATFTLEVLLAHGYKGEAREWHQWLLRAVAGDPKDLQIMYSVTGERRLYERALDGLAGYEGSRPVRIGNAASQQFQLDVYGEVLDSFHSARRAGVETPDDQWELEVAITGFVCDHWQEPDDGIWESRSGREHHVHSKVMAWVAVDRGIAAIERFGKDGPLDHWKQVRKEIFDEVVERGWSEKRGAFTRVYGDDELDASLLMMPIVGFLPPDDPRIVSTVEAIQEELMVDGLIRRYRTGKVDDGLPVGEGTFILCTFWLVDCLALMGRTDEATALFERLLELRNDVGLLSEQYDTTRKRLVGNFPQAFSHVALATAAQALEDTGEASAVRRGR
ncbi:MAG: hypothetical protein QOC87_902 [Actinomycetota bacterium]|jgi:GH15 family glucan-1,4-alpha-glucosidase|nr:hypothetical protein [Actinomycetota bacterium]